MKQSRTVTLDAKTLASCREAANRGASFAQRGLEQLDVTIQEGQKYIQNILTENTVKKDDPWNEQFQGMMKKQMKALGIAGIRCRDEVRENIENRRREMEKFSITLFGRTMAGKSTLMEILCHGDGSSIGQGAQRTTRDVRTYEWNGLRITDVPGIGAFKGEEDEALAIEAAKKGDLIVFLLTDDNPNTTESQWMAKLRQMGKPILGILNVKVNPDPDFELFQMDMESKFESQRLQEIIRQFFAFSHLSGQDWANTQFIPCHLLCAYEAQKEKDPERRKAYEEMSRFSDVTKALVDCVQQCGTMIRMKTFVDLAERPILDLRAEIQASLQAGHAGHDGLQSIMYEFQKRSQKFSSSFRKDKEQLLRTMRTSLRNVDTFVEENYQAKQEEIEDRFKDFIERKDLNGQLQRFVQEEDRKLQYLIDSTGKQFHQSIRRQAQRMDLPEITVDFKGGKPINVRFLLNAAVTVGAIFVPGGWAVRLLAPLALSGLSRYFTDSLDEKKKRRKQELRKALWELCDEILGNVKKQLRQYEQNVHELLQTIVLQNGKTMNMADRLQDIQQNGILTALDKNLTDMNRMLLETAYGKQLPAVQRIVRNMGTSMTLYVTDRSPFVGNAQTRAERLLQEKIIVLQA